MKTLLVTGTDTDVGKTYVSCVILRQLRTSGQRVGAWKPVCSGAITDDSEPLHWADVDQLADAIGNPTAKGIICPQTFRAAVAPGVAAKLEGREVNDSLIDQGPVAWNDHADYVIIEGAGGLLSPLSDARTSADIAIRQAAPVVIVAANRLGVINHTLLTAEVARQRGLNVVAVIVSDTDPSSDDESRDSNFAQLQQWLPDVLILKISYNGSQLCQASGERFDVARLFV